MSGVGGRGDGGDPKAVRVVRRVRILLTLNLRQGGLSICCNVVTATSRCRRCRLHSVVVIRHDHIVKSNDSTTRVNDKQDSRNIYSIT